MPLIGIITGGIDLTGLEYKIGNVAIKYGIFTQTIVDFVIIAFSIFLVIKIMNKALLKKKKEEPSPPGPSDIELLTEIRDLLKK
jgi:large conductance mechanosensitive channel